MFDSMPASHNLRFLLNVSSREHACIECGLPPAHPAPHRIAAKPTNLAMIAAAGTCCFLVQHVWDRTHRAHRKALHATHIFASRRFVTSFDMSGEQAHPIPAAAMVWLHSVGSDDALFREMSRVVPALFFDSVLQCERLDAEWFSEACVVVGRYATAQSDYVAEVPPYAIRVKSPTPSTSALLPSLRRASCAVDIRAASLLLYHLSVKRLSSTCTITRGCAAAAAASGAYSLLGPVLPKYAAECTFSVTGDRFIHLCLRMHLPSWCTMLSPGGCYRDLSTLIPTTVNDLVRPYVDVQVSELMRTRDAASDDVVLFVVIAALISELCGSAALGVRYNRDILFARAGIPVPFVLCDFPVAGLVSDAYGFVDGTTLTVCNGLGVGNAVSLWVSALARSGHASIVTAFVAGDADTTNPLCKYA